MDKYLNCGQTCIAPDYLLCARSVKEPLRDALRREIRAQYRENPLENPDYERTMNQKHFGRLLELIMAKPAPTPFRPGKASRIRKI